jgi:hypothetical protein
MYLRALFLALTLAPAAQAECLTFTSIEKGVAFTRADGHKGLARTKDGGIYIDYALNTGTAWGDTRRTQIGIFEKTWNWSPTDEYYVGGSPGAFYEYKRSGKQPEPRPGTTWATTLRIEETNDDGTEAGAVTGTTRVKVTYSFLDAQEVKLSGCKYTAIPVELRGPGAKLIRRWMYFPDLGFGLETRMTDPESGHDLKLGLTSMKAAP